MGYISEQQCEHIPNYRPRIGFRASAWAEPVNLALPDQFTDARRREQHQIESFGQPDRHHGAAGKRAGPTAVTMCVAGSRERTVVVLDQGTDLG